MANNIKALNTSAITPEVLVQFIAEHAKDLKELYVVGLPKDDQQEPCVWSTGEMGGLAFAILVLQDLAFKQLNGLLDEE